MAPGRSGPALVISSGGRGLETKGTHTEAQVHAHTCRRTDTPPLGLERVGGRGFLPPEFKKIKNLKKNKKF